MTPAVPVPLVPTHTTRPVQNARISDQKITQHTWNSERAYKQWSHCTESLLNGIKTKSELQYVVASGLTHLFAIMCTYFTTSMGYKHCIHKANGFLTIIDTQSTEHLTFSKDSLKRCKQIALSLSP